MNGAPIDHILRGAVDCVTREDLASRLAMFRPLRVKLGVDPTSPDIHLGHTVALRKLRAFQDAGHTAVLIIGDYTAQVGDPSGQNKTRPQVTAEEVERNAATYLAQVRKVLLPERLEVRRNGEWFSRLSFMDVIRLAGRVTVARIIERDDFRKRLAAQAPVGLHELLYPLMQGYDSVMVEADVELGGTDQLFNLLVGRALQEQMGKPPQICLTTPLLVGLDGSHKMSKSLGNYVGVTDAPREMYGKLMSIPDVLMKDYFLLLTDHAPAEIAEICDPARTHPRDAKDRLAREIVEQYHGAEAAKDASDEFRRVFARKDLPDEIPEVTLPAGTIEDGRAWIVKVIQAIDPSISGSQARRLIQDGGVAVDDAKVVDATHRIEVRDGMIVRVGKRRFARIRTAEDPLRNK